MLNLLFIIKIPRNHKVIEQWVCFYYSTRSWQQLERTTLRIRCFESVHFIFNPSTVQGSIAANKDACNDSSTNDYYEVLLNIIWGLIDKL